jgi:hypothetical protein
MKERKMGDLNRQWWRLGGFFGIAFVVLFIVAIIVQQALAGEPPSYDDPVQEIRAYWENEGQGYLVGDYLFGLAHLLLFLPFLVTLRAMLGIAEGGGQVFSRIALLAGLLGIAASLAAASSWSTLAFAGENLSDDAVTTLMYLDVAAWSWVPLPYGLLLLAASYVIFTSSILWRWLAIVGFILGIAAILSPLWLLDGDQDGPLGILGFVAFLGLAVWILVASIGMVMRKVEPVGTGPAAREDATT